MLGTTAIHLGQLLLTISRKHVPVRMLARLDYKPESPLRPIESILVKARLHMKFNAILRSRRVKRKKIIFETTTDGWPPRKSTPGW